MALDLFANLNHEDRLIVAACRRESAGAAEIGQFADPFASWAVIRPLIDRLYAHHIPGLALAAFERHGLFDRAEQDVRTALQSHLLRQRLRSGLFAMELERLADGFKGTGIECVVLKGASLALSAYTSPADRFMDDLDLLVRPDQVDAAVNQLLAQGYTNPWSAEAVRGYRTHHYHLPLMRPDGLIVELHWDLVKPGRAYRLDPLEVIKRTVPLHQLAETLRMPCVEDQILHAVVQQLQDGFTYFSRTVDLDRLVAAGRTEWDILATRAREYRLGPALAYALQVARHLLATDCPAEVIRALSPGRLARTHLSFFDPVRSALNQRFVGRPTAYNLLRLWLTQGDASRVSILVDLARDMDDHEPLKRPWALEDRQTHTSRPHNLVELAKLAALQGWTYLQAVAGLPTRRGRSQMRFWSSQLSNSERL